MTLRLPRFNPSAKLIILFLALAVIGRSKVAVLPGWSVPLPALLLAVELVACATAVAVVFIRVRAGRPARRRSGP